MKLYKYSFNYLENTIEFVPIRLADEELHTNVMSCVFDNILRIKQLSSCMQCTLCSLLGHWYFLVWLLPLTTTQPKFNVSWSASTKQLILFAMQTSKPQQHHSHRLYEMKVKFRDLWSSCEKSKHGLLSSQRIAFSSMAAWEKAFKHWVYWGWTYYEAKIVLADNSHTACQIQTYINTPLLNQTFVAM